MDELEALKQAKEVISKKISDLQDKQEAELLPQYQEQYTGKCFRYPNSDGTNKFWTYMQVREVKGLWISGDNISIDIDALEFDEPPGNVSIHTERGTLNMWLDYPITEKQFKAAYKKVSEKLQPY